MENSDMPPMPAKMLMGANTTPNTVSTHADKAKTIQTLQKIAEIFGSELVAEGIETDDDLRLLRDLGLTFGQGYFLARPHAQPCTAVQPGAVAVLVNSQVAVYPEVRQSTQANIFDRLNILQAPTMGPQTQIDQVAALFLKHPHLHALPLVGGDSPIGIINRMNFLDRYSKLSSRELWGNKQCLQWANLQPRLIESKHTIDDLLGILTSDDQRYLDDGFIVMDNDRYGYWRGDDVIRLVARVAACHVQERRDFLGHVGGDDFTVVFQSANWAAQCRCMIEKFNTQAAHLFDERDRQRGGIEAQDRQGFSQFFALTTLSIGAVEVHPGDFGNAEQVANAAAAAKQSADGMALWGQEAGQTT
ncbi:EAL domain-containing protein [Rhodoferax sp.]|uniref:EAL domain-containing protein n=1 Tax=Rhodoferax sp. TaxID=50421 RepID=UPI002716EEDB|nr:EAL domain-containing protein [Rhodoferax sp.]MDO9145378.1 EAL domain-containing protein [Rhodoferax sp.]MDP3865129.1 EAL domain-containing protein [Rhodoferax sp.]